MAGPKLSRRVGRAVCTGRLTPKERLALVDAAVAVESWEELHPSIRDLVMKVEARSGISRSLPTEEDEVSRADDEPEIDEGDDDFDPEIDYHVSCVDWDADDEAERAEFDEDDEDDELIRAMDRNRLKHYWTKGKGLVKWLGRPHPWTALYRHLRKYVGAERAKRMAAQWVHDVTGNWPGSDAHRVATGHKPRGSRIGPG